MIRFSVFPYQFEQDAFGRLSYEFWPQRLFGSISPLSRLVGLGTVGCGGKFRNLMLCESDSHGEPDSHHQLNQVARYSLI